jgi:hypothetical protein
MFTTFTTKKAAMDGGAPSRGYQFSTVFRVRVVVVQVRRREGVKDWSEEVLAQCVRLNGIVADIRLKTLERVFVSTAWLLYPSLKRWVSWKT